MTSKYRNKPHVQKSFADSVEQSGISSILNLDVRKLFNHVMRVKGNSEQAASSVEQFGRDLSVLLEIDPDKPLDSDSPHPDRTRFFKGEDKAIPRILDKATSRYNGDISAVGDIARWMLVFDSPKQVEIVENMATKPLNSLPGNQREFIEKYAARGITFQAVDNSYQKPKKHGFRGTDIKVRAARGTNVATCEIQMLHKKMQYSYEISRAAYEEVRRTELRISGVLDSMKTSMGSSGLSPAVYNLLHAALNEKMPEDPLDDAGKKDRSFSRHEVVQALRNVAERSTHPEFFAPGYANSDPQAIRQAVMEVARDAARQRQISGKNFDEISRLLSRDIDLMQSRIDWERRLFEDDAIAYGFIKTRAPRHAILGNEAELAIAAERARNAPVSVNITPLLPSSHERKRIAAGVAVPVAPDDITPEAPSPLLS